MIINIPQSATIILDTEYNVPENIVSQGKEATYNYIKEHFNEIPRGEMLAENILNDDTLDNELLEERIDEAFDKVEENERD